MAAACADETKTSTSSGTIEWFSGDGLEAYEKLAEKFKKNKTMELVDTSVMPIKVFAKKIKEAVDTKLAECSDPLSELAAMPRYARRDCLNYDLVCAVNRLNDVCDQLDASRDNPDHMKKKELSLEYFDALIFLAANKRAYESC